MCPGEPDKFVSVSAGRFTLVDGSTPATLRLGLEGMPGERVRMLVVSPPPASVLQIEAVVGTDGRASCRVDRVGNLTCA